MRGIIYLIQPCILLKTNRYKIGCSKSPTLDRCKKGYRKGTRYLCIMECVNPVELESKIKEVFDRKFDLIGGKEFYEGDENDILKEFIKLVLQHKNIYFKNDNNLKNINEKNKNEEKEELTNINNTIFDTIIGTDNDISDGEEENIKIIKTYEEYMKVSDFEKIIITNKKENISLL